MMTKTLVIDTETTGLNQGVKLDEAIEVGVVEFSDTGAHKRLLDVIVHSEVEIDDAAFAVHGITRERTALEGVARSELLDMLDELLTDDVDLVAGYNVGFDMRVLLNAYYAESRRLPDVRFYDVMRPHADRFGMWNVERDEPRALKLAAAYELQFGTAALDAYTAHSALDDALMTAELMRAIKTDTLRRNTEQFVVTLDRAEYRVNSRGEYLALYSVGGLRFNVFWRDEQRLLSVYGLDVYSVKERLRDRDINDAPSIAIDRLEVAVSMRGDYPSII